MEQVEGANRANGDQPGGLLNDVRVLDRTSGIAGPYCSKLFADAGADVVKVEAPAGDPLRRWRSGALFEYLNASKRSVVDDAGLLAGSDLLLLDQPDQVAEVRASHPALVVVTLTPFGCAGPWAGRPWTEFTLQAASGSTGQRGLPEHPPLAAGGRIGEWITGTYAAFAALAALREARRSGQGDHVDVAMLDTMALTMVTFPSVFASFTGWPPRPGTGRMIQIPSVEPTSDGYIVVTTNSGQQFQDFLVMIGHPELIADTKLAQANVRFNRRDEFEALVHEHTTGRTTEQNLEDAALLRIPAGPVLNGSSVLQFEQFRGRDVFVDAPSGRFRQPRVPYRIEGCATPGFRPCPATGEHTGEVTWPERGRAPEVVDGGGGGGGGWELPLTGIRVLDCTGWWAGPSATQALAALGADVIKVEAAGRPDGMRFATVKPPSQDGWWEWGPLFHGVNTDKRGITLDLGTDEGKDVFRRLLGTADVLVENYTPRVMEQFGLGWDTVHALNRRLVMVRMPAFGLDGPWRDRTGFAQTMEGVSGMAWLTGFPDGPPVLVLGACDPIAGLHAAFATLVALAERDRSGVGRLVESVMVEAALNVAAEQVVEFTATGELLGRDGNRGPGAVPQGAYRCRGEDTWVAIAVETDDQWRALSQVLGSPSWATAPDLAHEDGRRAAHDDIDRRLEEWTSAREAADVAERLLAAGVPASEVVPARDALRHPQLEFRGFAEVERHPVTGDHPMPMLPFRLSRVSHWLRRPAPTLGQHNDEVLADLGIGDQERAALRRAGVIGEQLAAH